jgi:hypothetical protein
MEPTVPQAVVSEEKQKAFTAGFEHRSRVALMK